MATAKIPATYDVASTDRVSRKIQNVTVNHTKALVTEAIRVLASRRLKVRFGLNDMPHMIIKSPLKAKENKPPNESGDPLGVIQF